MASSRQDRDADQIQADLGATRDSLVNAIEALIDQVHPERVKQRQVAGTKRFLHTEIEKAKSLVFNARGDLRTERIGIVGGAVAGAITLLVVLRTVVRRHRG